ncbi:MAG TPA: DUF5615 family PIN-like protein [Gemmataceae bacterium]|nr:DUF5615 family PIN-like protein [Gemmataceae bacterium]
MITGLSALRVYLDENVDVLLASLLLVHGFHCLTTAGVGHLRWDDETQLWYAFQESRILIMHNRVDLENLAVRRWAQQKDHAGIVLAIRRTETYELARHVWPVLRLDDQESWRNVVLYA